MKKIFTFTFIPVFLVLFTILHVQALPTEYLECDYEDLICTQQNDITYLHQITEEQQQKILELTLKLQDISNEQKLIASQNLSRAEAPNLNSPETSNDLNPAGTQGTNSPETSTSFNPSELIESHTKMQETVEFLEQQLSQIQENITTLKQEKSTNIQERPVAEITQTAPLAKNDQSLNNDEFDKKTVEIKEENAHNIDHSPNIESLNLSAKQNINKAISIILSKDKKIDINQAINLLKSTLNTSNDLHHISYYWLGKIYFYTKKWEEAYKFLTKTIETNFENEEIDNIKINYAISAYNLGKIEQFCSTITDLKNKSHKIDIIKKINTLLKNQKC